MLSLNAMRNIDRGGVAIEEPGEAPHHP